MLVSAEEVKSYRHIADSLIKDAEAFVIDHLPYFSPSVTMVNRKGEVLYYNMGGMGYRIIDLAEFAYNASYAHGAAGAIIIWERDFIDVPKDDPRYELVMSGNIDESSVPAENKKAMIMAYCEMLGNYRRSFAIPLNTDRTVRYDIYHELEKNLDNRELRYGPIIYGNWMLN